MIAEQKEHVSAETSEDRSNEHLVQLSLLLERVRKKLTQRPSERGDDIERDEDEMIDNHRNGVQQTAVVSDEPLPSYNAR
jgi:hypothetical protein